MIDVHIDSLTLENFGPFYGEHIFKFSNLEGRSGILIGGKNGAGKTHLLRALYLAVVGEAGVGDLKNVEKGSDATRFIFDKSLNRHAITDGNDTIRFKVVISKHDINSGGNRKVELHREIRCRPNSSPVWKSYALQSDTTNQTNTEDDLIIQRLRDTFLPRHLARFFFFDAERSQTLNLGHHDIVEGITRILGLWTYSELENDLRKLIKDKIPRRFNYNSVSDPETKLIDLTADILRDEGHLNTRKNELDILNKELHDIKSDLLDVEDDLKTIGAVDPLELEKFQNRRNELTNTKHELEFKLTEAWEMALPISLLGSYRTELYDDLLSEERRREWESAKSTVEPKIPQVKEDVFNNIPGEYEISDQTLCYLENRLENALFRLFNPPPEGMPDNIFITNRNDISVQIRQQLDKSNSSIADLSKLCEKIENLTIQIREIDQNLRHIHQNTTVFKKGSELHQKRGELNARQEQINKRIEEITDEITRLESDLIELKRQETIQSEIVEKARKGEGLATLAARYREAAGEIRNQAAFKFRKSISDYVGDLWIDITNRKREFLNMEFDKSWQCWLKRKNGETIKWEEVNTSAGQRQVRMLSFYEALRRLAKLRPPLVVDTPLARLDKEVRGNVLNQLYLSGHQSIILATDSEVDPESVLFEKIKDRLARVYTLHPSGKQDSIDYEVHVSSDYFGKTL